MEKPDDLTWHQWIELLKTQRKELYRQLQPIEDELFSWRAYQYARKLGVVWH